jgi:hypothetical protein
MFSYVDEFDLSVGGTQSSPIGRMLGAAGLQPQARIVQPDAIMRARIVLEGLVGTDVNVSYRHLQAADPFSTGIGSWITVTPAVVLTGPDEVAMYVPGADSLLFPWWAWRIAPNVDVTAGLLRIETSFYGIGG